MKTRFTKLRLLCRSLAGNGVYYLTITAPTFDEEVRRKRGIVITARVHPGETPSSWTMKGIIDFLTGESNQAKVTVESHSEILTLRLKHPLNDFPLDRRFERGSCSSLSRC